MTNIRRNSIVVALLTSLAGLTPRLVAEPYYLEDFSDDPGWTTDQPENFYWGTAQQDYFVRMANHHEAYQPSRYSYGVVPYHERAFTLEWDQMMTRVDWSAGVNVGLYGANMACGNFLPNVVATTVNLEYFRHDGGLAIGLTVCDGSGTQLWTYRNVNYVLNQSYHNSVEYDADAGTVSAVITGSGSGFPLTLTLSGVGELPTSMNRIGSSRYPFAEGGYIGVSEWAVAEARIDNVLLTPEPAALMLMGLGGVVMMRRRRAPC